MRNQSRATAVSALIVTAVLIAPPVTSAQPSKDLLVTTMWLADHLRDPKLVLVWTGGTAPARLIPGSRALPHDRIMTASGGHDLPPVEDLVATLRRAGISNDSHVVVYGEPMAAGWLFFALDYLGHDHVSWLDGGLEKWTADRRAVAAAVASSPEGQLTARLRPALKATAADVQSRQASGRAQVLDARSGQEYASGHIPGARSLDWQKVFADDSMSAFKKPDELAALFAQAGIAPGKPAITYCAVGLRGSVLYFAAKYAGFEVSNYVGSWRDWQEKKLPAER
jgi:thiosulfate/3-mercaptopyruvate sulfurtransferase